MLSPATLPSPEMTSPCSLCNTLPVSWVAPELGSLPGDEATLALAVGLHGRVRSCSVAGYVLFRGGRAEVGGGGGGWLGGAAGRCAEPLRERLIFYFTDFAPREGVGSSIVK